MDSLTQFALGAAVGVAALGRRTAPWKAALWGGICGTLPDLDSFIDHGDPVRNVTFHRAESHALFFLTLASPLLAWVAHRLHGGTVSFRRWWLALWLVLVTHPLLDVMTVYGTQLGLPFTDHPFGVGSIFIIDPLYTLPLLVGVAAALVLGADRGLRWNALGLALAYGYVAWSVAAQQHVAGIARQSLRESGLEAQALLVTPTPFNTVLWRVVALGPETYHEGFYSLLDPEARVSFRSFPRNRDLYDPLSGEWHAARIAWFSHGFFRMREQDGAVLMSDLRMGLEPHYTFTFVVGRRTCAGIDPAPSRLVRPEVDVGGALRWMWRRLGGDPAAHAMLSEWTKPGECGNSGSAGCPSPGQPWSSACGSGSATATPRSCDGATSRSAHASGRCSSAPHAASSTPGPTARAGA